MSDKNPAGGKVFCIQKKSANSAANDINEK